MKEADTSARADVPSLVTTSLRNTYNKDLPPVPVVVEQILYHGLTVLAGPPKVGKSFLALQIAIGVASGKQILGALGVVRRGRVLYLSLEDGERRLRKRCRDLTKTDDALDNIEVVYQLPVSLSQPGGIAAVKAAIKKRDYELGILDTLVGGFPESRKSTDAFREDYRQMQTIRSFTEETSMAFLVVAHNRKQEAEYALNAIAGTGGLTAAVDAALVMKKEGDGATLTVVSRDVEEVTLGLVRDPATSGWLVGVSDAACDKKTNQKWR